MVENFHPETHLKPPIQCLGLAEETLLVRMPGAQFLLRGTGIEDLAALVTLMDGKRSQADIVAALQDRYAPDAIARTMALLRQRQAPPVLNPEIPLPQSPGTASLAKGKVLCFGDQQLANALAKKLPDQVRVFHRALAEPTQTDPAPFWQYPQADIQVGDAGQPPIARGEWDLVVCLAEGQSYGAMAQIRKLAGEAGTPCLFAYQSALGWELSPISSPGTACFLCTQQALFQSIFGGEPAFPTIAPLRTFPWPGEKEPYLHWLVHDIIAFLDPARRTKRRESLLRIVEGTSAVTHLAVSGAQHCPHCGPASNDPKTPKKTAKSAANGGHVEPTLSAAQSPTSIKRIGILGGGTAGYLTALALKAKHPGLEISLIESPKVAVIGVGEATTPLMLQFLHVDLGLDMADFFKQVQPTFKLGIRFDWGPQGTSFFHYPFGPLHLLESLLYQRDIRFCNLQAMCMTAWKLPLIANSKGAWQHHWDCNLAYHLDNRRFVAYLQNVAAARGIQRVLAHVDGVEKAEDGQSVTCLRADDGRRMPFDLYVDCTGFRAMLLHEALGSPFKSFGKSLFTNRAIIANLPNQVDTPPYTQAMTMDAGWCWNTPQRDAHHCGYVFSSAFIDDDEAEKEMRRRLPTMSEARCIRFRSGRHRDFWKGNVVAMGNAYGFVEPLESTALHMLIRQIGMLCLALPAAGDMRRVADGLNHRVGTFWDYLCWFLALHYRFNTRKTTPFWQACRHETDLTSHEHLLQAFHRHGPLSMQSDLAHAELAPDPLWGPEGVDLLLLAMGQRCPLPKPAMAKRDWQARQDSYRDILHRSLDQNRALAAMDRNAQLLDAILAPFRAFGPAFKSPIYASVLQ